MVHLNPAAALYESRFRVEQAARRASLLGTLGPLKPVAAPAPLQAVARPLLETVELRRAIEAEALGTPHAA
jgi:hypothetical protein